VYTLIRSCDRLYAGGEFTWISNAQTPRGRMAAIGLDGTPTAWNPSLNDYVQAIVRSDEQLIAGGTYTTAGSSNSSRPRLAAFDNIVESGCTTSTPELENSEAVNVYPNPSSGAFTLSTEGLMDRAEVMIFDAQGRQVAARFRLDGKDRHSIDLTDQANGLYVIRIMTQDRTIMEQVIVQR